MPWAARRKLLILIIIAAVVIAFLAVVSIATVYKAPSCTDTVSNQGETGIDCGGPCPYLCTAETQAPTVLFTKALKSGSRIDVIASIENKNPQAAAKRVPYRIELYGADRLLIGDVAGTIDLPPGSTMPIFAPNVSSGKQTIANAFLTIDPASFRWFPMASDPRTVPSVSNITQSGASTTPRIDATLTNGSVRTLSDVRVIIFVRDADKNIIAASQTVVPIVPAQGSATATFTWNAPFPSPPAEIQVYPLVPLP